jgi:hypothetical protein
VLCVELPATLDQSSGAQRGLRRSGGGEPDAPGAHTWPGGGGSACGEGQTRTQTQAGRA